MGLLFSAALRMWRFHLPAEVYDFDTLPVKNEPLGLILIALCAMAICTLASVLPAAQAARLKPVEALRYE
jgi:lipoprotein-releasing system permease protein